VGAIVIMTSTGLPFPANGLRDEALPSLESGMNAYLPKSVRRSQLKAAIEGELAAATQGSASPSAPVDLGVLTALVGEDPSVIAELLQAFRESAAESRGDIQRSLKASLTQPAADAAHRLKSAARTVGALKLGDICAEIEKTHQGGCTDALHQLLARFEIELDVVLRFLESN
jgi:HPt (histidine-containing phosphotransfer) domain-containing protein